MSPETTAALSIPLFIDHFIVLLCAGVTQADAFSYKGKTYPALPREDS